MYVYCPIKICTILAITWIYIKIRVEIQKNARLLEPLLKCLNKVSIANNFSE